MFFEEVINNDILNNIKDEESAVEFQKQLNKYIKIDENLYVEKNNTCAGVDLAYWMEGENEYAVCCITVIDLKSNEIVENVHSVGKIDFPYIPGCLSFRELPLILETVKKLKDEPDLYIFDGNGYLHPRHMGIATHAAIYLNKPAIGVAKSYYKIFDTDFTMPDDTEGSYTDIIINGEVYGRALRTHKGVKPIFISAGNFIDIETSTEIIKSMVTKESRIPVPTRLADLETHKMRTLYKNKLNSCNK